MRGVHGARRILLWSRAGSSPHARGPHGTSAFSEFGTRIIPACAGSTRLLSPLPHLPGDHPRMRGVHNFEEMFSVYEKGSSPHARGPLGFFRLCRISQGIIPACAGSTINKRIRIPIRWDHPRMRGVHNWLCLQMMMEKGSSPHARGPREQGFEMLAVPGIIPACAGSTGLSISLNRFT